MAQIRLRILGECVIEIGERIVLPRASHLFALLLYLGAESPRRVSRATLADLLFPDDGPSVAAHNLRQLLYRLRRLDAPLRTSPQGEALDEQFVIDMVKVEIQRSYPSRLQRAPATYALLPHYEAPNAQLSEWLESYRDRQRSLLVRALVADLDAARRSANWVGLEALAKTLLELDPYHESATLCLAEAMARAGSKQRAVAVLQQYEEDTARTAPLLALPSQLLKRRIVSASPRGVGDIPHMPLVGRQAEMTILGEHWSHAAAGNFSTVLITGERSVGKSRLVSEFLSIVRLDGTGSIVFSRRLASDRQRPLSLFADITKQMLCLPGAAGCSPEQVSALLRLTETPSAEATMALHAGPDNDHEMRATLSELIDCVTSEKPIVMAIDDAHFLDEASAMLLEQIAERNPRMPLLVLMLAERATTQACRASRMRLGPIDRDSLGTLVDRYAAQRGLSLSEQAREWYCTVAAGNAGHLELLLSSEAQSAGQEIPLTLLSLTDERIASLSSEAQHALCAIAIIGSDCSVDIVGSLTGLGQHPLIRVLEELESKFLVLAGPTGLRCRSLLIQERILAASATSVKQLLHARAARAVQRAFSPGAFSQAAAWQIAEHWLAAGNPARARQWQRRCWRHAIVIGQPATASMSIRHALAGAQSPKERAALLDELANAVRSEADIDSLIPVLRERASLCEQCEDSPAARTALAFDLVEAALRNYDDDLLHLVELRSLVASRDLDPARRIRATRSLIISAHNLLQPTIAAEAHEIIQGLGPPDRASELLRVSAMMIYHTVFGDRDQAIRHADELTELARRSTLLSERLSAVLNVGLARWNVDARPLDLSATIEGYELAAHADASALALHLASQLATFAFEAGQLDDARRWGRCALEWETQHHLTRLPMDYLTIQASLAMLAQDGKGARHWIDRMPIMSPKARSGLTQDAVFVFDVLCRQVCHDSPVEEADLARLLSAHQLARCYGKQDYQMEALWLSLRRAGRAQEAHDSLKEYLTVSRRERRPPNYTLRLRTSLDPVWT